MFPANILPGQGFKQFTVYETGAKTTASGRPVTGQYVATKKQFLGMLMNASQKEIDQWKQNGHPITHKIIEYGAMQPAKPTDCLSVLHENRDFYVQGTKNPADLNVTRIFYVEERLDIKKEKLEEKLEE